MTPPQWGIPALLVLGVVVIGFGWWWDRRRNPKPGEGFVTDDDLDGLAPPRAPATPIDVLLAARADHAGIPGGLADAAFLTHPREGVAVAEDALVLVTDATLDDDRLLIDALARAQQDGRPLVVAAPEYGFRALDTLRANLLTGRVAVLPVELSDPALLQRTAQLCGGTVVPDADLRSGWLPPDAWGAVAIWVADLDDSWIEPRH